MTRSVACTSLLLLAALLACKSGSPSSPAADAGAASSEEREREVPVGKLGNVTASQLEARAKKAGYELESSNEDQDSGAVVSILELESEEYYAYVTLVDLGSDTSRKHASRMGENAGLAVHFDDAPDGVTAAKLCDEIVAKKPLGELSRGALKQVLGGLGWDVSSSSSDSEDGVVTSSLVADRADDQVSVVLFDFKAARREGRLVVDGKRFLNVFVCHDCTKRKEGVLADLGHRRRARKLLAKLTEAE
jgi:hypothetical protein